MAQGRQDLEGRRETGSTSVQGLVSAAQPGHMSPCVTTVTTKPSYFKPLGPVAPDNMQKALWRTGLMGTPLVSTKNTAALMTSELSRLHTKTSLARIHSF